MTGTLFASPGRLRSKQWAQFVRDKGLLFHGVERRPGYRDPNDEAIIFPEVLGHLCCMTLRVSQSVPCKNLDMLTESTNSDVSESMLVFANMSKNKRLLRETGNLPDATDSESQLDAKIRQAFLSIATTGHWQVPPKDTRVRNLLFRDGYLPAETVSQPEVLSAMQLYSRRHGLPARQTYLGIVWQITQQINSADPDRREVVGGF